MGLFKWWRNRQRQIDLTILWPVCKEEASKLYPDNPMDHAKAAFAYHCYNDAAWTKDYSQRELFNYIDRLQ